MAAFHEPPGKGQALCRVMIAAYDNDRHTEFRQPDKKIVKQLDGVGRRDRLVVNISGDQKNIGAFTRHDADNFVKYICLIL